MATRLTRGLMVNVASWTALMTFSIPPQHRPVQRTSAECTLDMRNHDSHQTANFARLSNMWLTW
eukprot:4119661-Amphidinium_carterae.1